MSDAFEIYQRMSDNERYAIVAHVIDKGRHLENLDEWTKEDNFQTTDDLVTAYRAVIHPHEDPNPRCDCGNERHHDDGLTHCTECDETYGLGTGGDGKCADCLNDGPEGTYSLRREDPDGRYAEPMSTLPPHNPRLLTLEDARGWLVGHMVNAGMTEWTDVEKHRNEVEATGATEWQGYRFTMTETEGE